MIDINQKYGKRAVQSLLDILRFCADANELISRSYQSYLDDPMLRRAARSIIADAGEAVSRIDKISPALIADHPELELRELKNARNFIVHAYDGVDYDVLWEILEVDFPRTCAATRILFGEGRSNIEVNRDD
jgi:uncharacterized protein with HEPN domain